MCVSTAALLRDGNRLLFVRRPPGGDLSECWELPGGKVDPGEEPAGALRRELEEELGIDARVGEQVASVQFRHRGTAFELRAFAATADLSTLELREHTALRWCTPADALELDLAPSDRELLGRLT